MKIIWQEVDIKVGRIYGKRGMKETWMIGYRPEIDGAMRYVSISMVDGMITLPRTTTEMAEILTSNEYWPIELLAFLDSTKEHQ